MKITKYNIIQHIEEILKNLKIRFTIINRDSKGCHIQLYISSIEGNIQVEYSLDDVNDNYFCIQFFTDIDSDGLSLYYSHWDNDSNDSIEVEIEELLNSIKRINQGISKIQTKINQIKDICEEYNLEFDNFIGVLYDFDD